jgi:hypothetical protein
LLWVLLLVSEVKALVWVVLRHGSGFSEVVALRMISFAALPEERSADFRTSLGAAETLALHQGDCSCQDEVSVPSDGMPS